MKVMDKKVEKIDPVRNGNINLHPRKSSIYSESQIQKLNSEFRRIQKECISSKMKYTYHFGRNEREKVEEILKTEKLFLINDNCSSEVLDLLLTDGKIDIDKVICLHVLSIQQSTKCLERQGEENESDKSKINPLTRYSKYLPCYLVANKDTMINCNCWPREEANFSNSERFINIHLQVNCQVEGLIQSVINVLANLNPAKLNVLSSRAHSAEEVNYVLGKTENFKFISSLLLSKFIQKNTNMRRETCCLMTGKTELIQDIGKFKKNMVFRIDVPRSLLLIYNDIDKRNKKTPPKAFPKEKDSSFEELLQIKKRVGSNISIIPGYKLLQKGSSSGGIAVIDQTATSISYLAAGSGNNENESKNDLTIFMQSPKISDHQYVIEKMSEMEGDKIVLTKPRNKIEETCLKIAKRNMKTEKKILQDDINHQEIKEDILKRLTNEERLAIAEKAAKIKNLTVNAKGELESVPVVNLFKGSVDRNSLLKLVNEATDKEKEVMFKPTNEGGMGIGELLIDNSELSMLSQFDKAQNVKDVAVIGEMCHSRAPKNLNIELNSLFRSLKIEQEVAKKEIEQSCGAFIKRLKHK